MNLPIEGFIVVTLGLYFTLGFSQILTSLQMKKEASSLSFPRKDFFVSVIIPVKAVSATTQQNLESVCMQDYPRFEVLFVAEEAEHQAYKVVRGLGNKYRNVKVLLSGQHDGSKTIAKCHNIVYAARHAKGDVLLFGDSDVSYSRDWIVKMTSPLTERIQGKRIDAVTAPFFIEPRGFIGKFIALSVSLVTFTASFTSRVQSFPSFASGASIAVTRKVFDECGVEEIWEGAFNDDLVFADTLIDNGYYIYNQLDHLNHPKEAFPDLSQTKEKLIRWVITISTFGHRSLRAKVPVMVLKNLQFQVALVFGLVLYFSGFSWVVALGIVVAGYVYLVAYRWTVGHIIEERGLDAYYILAPISVTAMMLFYAIVKPFFRTFSWEGKAYTVKGRYSR